MNLSEWIKLRTFHYKQFYDIKSLVSQKRAQRLTISLCLPTLNEEKTIGSIIKTLKKELQDRYPLLDEIMVIDSGSTDRTVEIVRQKGVPLYFADEVLPKMGSYRGKGENLWKSLYLARGDIIVWLDTDIENMHPRFVYGLVGPLLFQPEIGFVKGFYRRPLRVGKKLQPVGGGRVTEILVKPFFNMLFPQLAVFHQPLSGEYAGRRELLERVPFFTGYGVETGLLIDVESRFGISRMAQVDLDVRIHHNKDVEALKCMSFGILRVLFMRSEQMGKMVMMDNLKSRLMTMVYTEQNFYKLIQQEVVEIERPPMILVDAYQKRRHLDEEDLVLVEEIQKRRSYSSVHLSPYLERGLIILNGDAPDKETVLMNISTLLAERGVVPQRSGLMHEFLRRESSMSTGIGVGIAIPHAIFEGVKRLRILIYRNLRGIDFNALDGEPVYLVFAVVAPHSRRQQYLEILASLANILKDYRIRELLLRAEQPGEIIKILRKAEIVKQFERELRLIES